MKTRGKAAKAKKTFASTATCTIFYDRCWILVFDMIKPDFDYSPLIPLRQS